MKHRKPAPQILIAIALGPICAAAADLPARDVISQQPVRAPVPLVHKGAPRELDTRYSAEILVLKARPEKTSRKTSTASAPAALEPARAGIDSSLQMLSLAGLGQSRLRFSAPPTSQGP
jgi:hypothetical protein